MVKVTIKDDTGAVLAGPLSMAYVADSDGTYRAVFVPRFVMMSLSVLLGSHSNATFPRVLSEISSLGRDIPDNDVVSD